VLSDGLGLLAGALVSPFDLTGRWEAALCWEEACIADVLGLNVERHALTDFERRSPVDLYVFMIRKLQDIYANGEGSIIGPQSATKGIGLVSLRCTCFMSMILAGNDTTLS